MIYRYTDEHLIQLAIIPGPNKPKDLDSFLLPVVDELKDLERDGIVIRDGSTEICRAKVHLIICSGDIPAVADMAHFGSHTSIFGCRICEVQGIPPKNRSNGKYFTDRYAPMRPLIDFKQGNSVSIIYADNVQIHLHKLNRTPTYINQASSAILSLFVVRLSSALTKCIQLLEVLEN